MGYHACSFENADIFEAILLLSLAKQCDWWWRNKKFSQQTWKWVNVRIACWLICHHIVSVALASPRVVSEFSFAWARWFSGNSCDRDPSFSVLDVLRSVRSVMILDDQCQRLWYYVWSVPISVGGCDSVTGSHNERLFEAEWPVWLGHQPAPQAANFCQTCKQSSFRRTLFQISATLKVSAVQVFFPFWVLRGACVQVWWKYISFGSELSYLEVSIISYEGK